MSGVSVCCPRCGYESGLWVAFLEMTEPFKFITE